MNCSVIYGDRKFSHLKAPGRDFICETSLHGIEHCILEAEAMYIQAVGECIYRWIVHIHLVLCIDRYVQV